MVVNKKFGLFVGQSTQEARLRRPWPPLGNPKSFGSKPPLGTPNSFGLDHQVTHWASSAEYMASWRSAVELEAAASAAEAPKNARVTGSISMARLVVGFGV